MKNAKDKGLMEKEVSKGTSPSLLKPTTTLAWKVTSLSKSSFIPFQGKLLIVRQTWNLMHQ